MADDDNNNGADTFPNPIVNPMEILTQENQALRKQIETLREELECEKSKQNKFVHDMNHEVCLFFFFPSVTIMTD